MTNLGIPVILYNWMWYARSYVMFLTSKYVEKWSFRIWNRATDEIARTISLVWCNVIWKFVFGLAWAWYVNTMVLKLVLLNFLT